MISLEKWRITAKNCKTSPFDAFWSAIGHKMYLLKQIFEECWKKYFCPKNDVFSWNRHLNLVSTWNECI